MAAATARGCVRTVSTCCRERRSCCLPLRSAPRRRLLNLVLLLVLAALPVSRDLGLECPKSAVALRVVIPLAPPSRRPCSLPFGLASTRCVRRRPRGFAILPSVAAPSSLPASLLRRIRRWPLSALARSWRSSCSAAPSPVSHGEGRAGGASCLPRLVGVLDSMGARRAVQGIVRACAMWDLHFHFCCASRFRGRFRGRALNTQTCNLYSICSVQATRARSLTLSSRKVNNLALLELFDVALRAQEDPRRGTHSAGEH